MLPHPAKNMQAWKRCLLAAPRRVGDVELMAYDSALRRLVITQYLEYNGLLNQLALEEGLYRALLQYPIFLGKIHEHLPRQGAVQLAWDSHDAQGLGFDWSAAASHRQPPNLWSNWRIWADGLAPAVTGRVAAAKVTVFPAADKSILIFAFDHAICDYPTAYKFMQLWFKEAAAAAVSQLAAGVTAEAAIGAISPSGSVDMLVSITPTTEIPTEAKLLLSGGGITGSNISSLGGAATAANEPGRDAGCFSRSCYESCPHWQLPANPYSITGASNGFDQQQRRLLQEASRQWLARHFGATCPFPWNPLSPADSCRMAWTLLVNGLTWTFCAWKIPRQLLEDWKDAATAARPLPDGLWYSANTAATAMLVSTLYKAAPEKARAQGGLHVASVVDIRGGRCGLSIPCETLTNPSIWGIRTWVPEHILAAANGQPSPDLMYCLRVGLSRQLADPRGSMNRQYEWWEAVRRAGRCHEVRLAQGLQQLDEDDVCVDWLITGASGLPTLPGTSVSAASVRWLPGYFKRMIMASPVPAAAAGSAGDGCRSSSSFDIQFEVCLPASTLRRVSSDWQQLGLQPITTPARDLGYWQPLDAFVYPYVLQRTLEDMFLCLPAFIWRWNAQQLAWLWEQELLLLNFVLACLVQAVSPVQQFAMKALTMAGVAPLAVATATSDGVSSSNHNVASPSTAGWWSMLRSMLPTMWSQKRKGD